MTRKIDQRNSMSRASGLSQWDAGSAAAPSPLLSLSATALATEAVSQVAATTHALAASDTASADDATVGPLLAGTPDWGIGLGNLSATQDTDMALFVTGDPNAGGLAMIKATAAGFQVLTGYSVDGFLMSRIVGSAGHDSNGVDGLLHAFREREGVFLTGQTAYTAHQASDILGGSAGETIVGSNGDDLVRSGSGNDNVIGGLGTDILWGDSGNDVLAGNDGADQLWGGSGTDSLDGGVGDDVISAGSGADTLQGGDGNDVLMGGTDADSIVGGEGADTIIGGAGADNLTGGAGADIFMFMAGDAGVTATTQDTITDFTVGTDKIDLTGFAHTFNFHELATATAVDPKTAYEVLLLDNDTGSLVKIDSNGDGVVDMWISVTSTDHIHLTATDFII